MTTGLPILNELRAELERLVGGEPFVWQRLGGSYDLLRRALVEVVRGSEGRDPAPLLDQCWALLSSPGALVQVARFHRLDPHYAGVAVDSEWLHRNACALVATARAALGAQRRDGPALAHWAGVSGRLLGHEGGEPPDDLRRSTAAAGDLVDAAFRGLTEAGWRVQAARVWTLAWLPRGDVPKSQATPFGRRGRRPQDAVLGGPAVRVPVAGCFDGEGFLADLCLYRLAGDGELAPHPETALQPLGAQLLAGLREAWEVSGQSVCFTFGVHDASVPSWLPLEGTSLSGAAALGFELLRRGHSGDSHRLVIAQVVGDGSLEPVGHEVEKMQAALAAGVPSVVLAEESQIPETCVERFRQSGQEVLRARALREVLDLPPVRARPPGSGRNHRATALVASVAVVLAAAGAVVTSGDLGEDGRCPSTSSPDLSVAVAAVWSENEEEAFESVLDEFCDRSGIRVDYSPTPTDDMARYLAERRCDPPDVAMLAQPGLLRELARSGQLRPLEAPGVANLRQNYAPASMEVGAVDGVQYGVYFKASNKSVWWYNVHALNDADVTPPATWAEMVQAAEKVSGSGMPWLAIGAEDGWTLTDLFENVYLRSAGEGMYDQLADHRISWEDPTVVEALRMLSELLDDRYLAGGSAGVLRTDWKTSVLQVFTGAPKAATVFEGDFVLGYANEHTKAKPGRDLDFFPFPAVRDSPPAVVGGGDIGVALTDSPAAQQLLAFLATPEAASVWARQPGFTSPNRNVAPTVYRDDLTTRAATTLASAEIFRFDLSDQQSPAFGANEDAGMWHRFQEFVRHRDPVATAKALEADWSAVVPKPEDVPCGQPGAVAT